MGAKVSAMCNEKHRNTDSLTNLTATIFGRNVGCPIEEIKKGFIEGIVCFFENMRVSKWDIFESKKRKKQLVLIPASTI